MTLGPWTISDIPWTLFDRPLVDEGHVILAKVAAIIEENAADQGVDYLSRVFCGDDFVEEIRNWGRDERRHGKVLARYCELVDPDYHFGRSYGAYCRKYRVNTAVEQSSRGSHAGEMVARCIVEVGTTSFYRALADSSREPLFTFICRKIASDEFRHFKLFYDKLGRCGDRDSIGRLTRLRIAIGRISETSVDELGSAYWAATEPNAPYDAKRAYADYMALAMRDYRAPHLDYATAMIFKACGLRPRSRLQVFAARASTSFVRRRQRQAARSQRRIRAGFVLPNLAHSDRRD
jgi:hypothetical protein